ncbi:50S ribosomal protein L37e [Candidatus Woesearchaeota archaeon]|nr:MAG: 50S ribosomal protein L37e [Candidatus Woesearchaeota archaeon]
MKGLGGTGSQGLRSKGKTHIPCRRCGRSSYHATKGVCASCGYGAGPKTRKYAWKNTRKRAK